ncbi:MAG: PAS domain S-box protein [Nitrospirae bacterium]|nr:PAS domain S-box protein [Nitrospirota bacterium]
METKLKSHFRKSLLIKHLLLMMTAFSMLLVLVLTVAFGWLNYENRIKDTDSDLAEIEQTHSKAVSTALWNLDRNVLYAQINGLLNYNHISYVAISDGTDTIIETGVKKSDGIIAREIPLAFDRDDSPVTIGTLYIQSDKSGIIGDVIRGISRIILLQTVTVGLTAFFLFILFNREVTRHLFSIANYFVNHAPDFEHISKPLRLARKTTGDEIDILADSFNQMRENLASAYAELHRKTSRLSALYDETPIMMHSIDRSGNLVKVNNHWLRTMGYGRDDVIGRKVVDFYTDESRKYAMDVVQPAFFQTGIAKDIQLQYVKKSGEIIDVLLSATGERDSDGNVVRSRAVIEDVTERKRAEQVLMESEEQFRALVEQSITGIAVIQNGVFVFVNSRLSEMFGYRSDEMTGRHPPDFVLESDRDMVRESLRKRMSGEIDSERLTFRVARKDGSERHVELFSKAMTYKGSRAFLSTLMDITEQKSLEEQLRQAQKMEAIGQLAGGVAHDFNNILSAIIGYASLARMRMGDSDTNRQNIDQILASSERAAALTQSLLSFSRKQVVNLAGIELNDIVAGFEKFLLRLLREDICLRTGLSPVGLPVLADRGQIEQMLMNLVTNARDAMPNGGSITIATEAVTMDRLPADPYEPGHGSGDYALITVKDTGTGIAENVRERIFEPFFTTKEVGKGTGLGLSMVYGIVRKHNGFVDVESRPGMGSEFRIYLPVHKLTAETEEQKAERTAPLRGGSETILVAEDNDMLRKLAATVLKQYGYTVIEAVDGMEAIAKFTENRDRISLLLLDGIMPRMNGKQAWEEIRLITPDIKAIFISGYSEDIFTKDGIPDGEAEFIQKPIQPSHLIRAVRKALEG